MATRRRRANSGALLAFAVRLLEVSAAHGGRSGRGTGPKGGASAPPARSSPPSATAFRPCHHPPPGRRRGTPRRDGVSAPAAAASASGRAAPPRARRRGSALRYVDSSSSSPPPGDGGPDAARGEFTLLRPHLQFSEVDIQELFCRDSVHGALEELWRADAEEKQRGR